MKNKENLVSLLEKICLVSDLEGDLEAAADKWPRNLHRGKKGKIAKPDVVVYPASISEISEILKIANCRGVPVVPFGGGSGVLGAANAVCGGIAVDMSRMDKLVFLDEANLTAVFQAGINGLELEEELNRRGFTLGHFPASIAISTLGGWLATRSSGQYATKYGKIEDMVLGLKIVLASGEVLDLKPKPGHSLGPDLTPLFLGSEGTLGIISEAALKITPLPEFRKFAAFSFLRVERALEICRQIIRAGVKPAVMRIYDPADVLFNGPKEHSFGKPEKNIFSDLKNKTEKFFAEKPDLANSLISAFAKAGCLSSLLVLVFEGNDKTLVSAEHKAAIKIVGERLGGRNKGEKPARLWFESRYKLSYEKMLSYFAKGIFVDTLDVSVPWDKAMDVYAAVKEAAGSKAIVFAHFSHFSPQNLCVYFTFAGSGKSGAEAEKSHKAVWDGALAACLAAGGIISHHHGVGLAKKERAEKQLGENYLKTLRIFKAVLDKNNILNPGKIF